MNSLFEPSRIIVASFIVMGLMSGCGGSKPAPQDPEPPVQPEGGQTDGAVTTPETSGTATNEKDTISSTSKVPDPSGPRGFDETDTLDRSEKTGLAAFDGDWVGHDNQGRIINFKINAAENSFTLQSQFYKGPPKGETGPCMYDEATKEVLFGCTGTSNCTHRGYITTDNKLYLTGKADPAAENGWKGIDQKALLVSVDDPQAGEFTSFRIQPPYTEETKAAYEAFRTETDQGGDNYTSVNAEAKVQYLDAPPNEEDFIWIIRPREDRALIFPSSLPVEAEPDPTVPPVPAYNEIPLEAMVVAGKQPPDGRVQLMYEASLATRRTDRAKKQLALNPGVNLQDFAFKSPRCPREEDPPRPPERSSS
ncbi:MAG: hypothetical protein AAF492_13240, partial [Verrucomicrobiota bacterium]